MMLNAIAALPSLFRTRRRLLKLNSMLIALRRVIPLLASWLVAASAAAQDGPALAGHPLTITGFGTLGLTRSDQDTVQFVRDLSQPWGATKKWTAKVDSVLGIQAGLKLGAATDGVVQLISRYRYDASHAPEVSWAFLRHDFAPDFQLRAGRLGTEFYMLGDSRLIGYANTTVRPPHDFYGPLIFSYFDGVDATASAALGDGLLRAKLFYGKSPESSPFFDDITWDLKGSRLLGGYLDYFTGPWQLRLAHAEVKFPRKESPLSALANRFMAANPMTAPLLAAYTHPLTGRVEMTDLVPELSTRNTTAGLSSLGVIYDDGPLQVIGMLGRIRYETAAYEDSRAAFVIASYRLGNFTPYWGYSLARSKGSTISTRLPGLSDFAKALTGATHIDQRTLTLGLRWDFHEHWAMKLQLDTIRGNSNSLFLFRGPDAPWNGRIHVLSATLDFTF